MNEVVKLERHDVIGIVTVNNPPVNALSAAVRGGILDCMKKAIADPEVKAIVLTSGSAIAFFMQSRIPPRTAALSALTGGLLTVTMPMTS